MHVIGCRRPRLWCLWVALLLVVDQAPASHSLEAKWTPNEKDEDGPLPLSQKYRDKLDELEAKVGPEKFRELTGMTPPSQRATPGVGGGGGSPLQTVQAMVRTLHAVAKNPATPPVLASVAVGALVWQVWHHYQMTGFRVWREPHLSIQPPPSKYITEWLRARRAATDQDAAVGSGEPEVHSVVLGTGDEAYHAAKKVLHSLRMCERHDTVELTNLDFVGLPRQRGSLANKKLVAVLTPWRGLWLLLPFRVTRERRSGTQGHQSAERGDEVEFSCLPQGSAPWQGTLACELQKDADTGEVSFQVTTDIRSISGFDAVRRTVAEALVQGMHDVVEHELFVSNQRHQTQAAYRDSSSRTLRGKQKRRREAQYERSDTRALGRFRGGALDGTAITRPCPCSVRRPSSTAPAPGCKTGPKWFR